MVRTTIEDAQTRVNGSSFTSKKSPKKQALDLSGMELAASEEAKDKLRKELTPHNPTPRQLARIEVWVSDLPPMAKLFALAILEHSPPEESGAAVALRKAQTMMSVSRDGADRAAKNFAEWTLAKVEKGGGRKATRYSVLKPVMACPCDSTQTEKSRPKEMACPAGQKEEEMACLAGHELRQWPAERATTLRLTAAAAAGTKPMGLSAPSEPGQKERASATDHNPAEPLKVDLALDSNYRARLFTAAGEALMDEIRAPQIASMGVPQMWLNEGASFEEDVLPTVRRMCVDRKPRSVRAWTLFTGAVADAKATRESAAAKAKEAMGNGVDKSNGKGYSEPTKEENADFWSRLEAKIKEKQNAKSNGSLPETPKAIF